ncbi:MAG: WD40 repeat domain-containing protein [Candidatus Aminicenantaceae bacterium]
MTKKSLILSLFIILIISLYLHAEEIDLISKASEARWINSDNKILQFGTDGGENGTAKYNHNVTLENGKRLKRVLYTHPQWKNKGEISGVFLDIAIPREEGKLIVAGGFLKGANSSDGVVFSVYFVSSDGFREEISAHGKRQIQRIPIGSFHAKYDRQIDRKTFDLSSIAGKRGYIILSVNAGESSDADWAVWTEAKLVRGKEAIQPHKKRVATLSGHGNRVYGADFSEDGKYVVTAGGDRLVKMWKIPDGRIIRNFKGHSSHVFSARFSPNSRLLVTAGGETAKIWQVSTGTQVKMLKGHTKKVHSAVFNSDGSLIATASEDGTVKIWDAHNGRNIRTIPVTNKGWVYSASFSSNSRLLAVGAHGGIAGIWNVSNGRKIRSLDGHSRAISSVCFSPNNKHVLTASIDDTIRIWEASTGRTIRILRGERPGSAYYSPDGQFIISANGDGRALIWDASSGKQMFSLKHSSPAFRVLFACFSPDGKYIVTTGEDNNAVIWKFSN